MSKEIETLKTIKENHWQLKKEKYRNHAIGTLDGMKKTFGARYDLIEQALNRNEPMKIKDWYDDIAICPNCHLHTSVNYSFCPFCGQAIEMPK